jgi:hypothetical protein
MSYDQVINNLSLYYSDTTITSGITLSHWNRVLYDVDASAGNIVITLPPQPSATNLMERGSLFFRRLDASTNTVTVVANLQGNITNVPLYPETGDVHWFMGVSDTQLFDDTFHFILSSKTDSSLVSVVTTSSNYTANPYDHLINVDASGGSVTITVPLAINQSKYVSWKTFSVIKTDTTSNPVIIQTTFPDTFSNGATSIQTKVPFHRIDLTALPGSVDVYVIS